MATSKNSSNNRKSSSASHKAAQTRQRNKEMQMKKDAFRDDLLFWSVFAFSAILFLANLGVGGAVGNAVGCFFFGVFGVIAYVLPIVFCIGCFFVISNKDNGFALMKAAAILLLVIFICVFFGLFTHGNEQINAVEAYKLGFAEKRGGGFIGTGLSYLFVQGFGLPGAYIIDLVIMILSLVVITERSALRGVKKGGKKVYETAREGNDRYLEYREMRQEERAKRRMDRKVSGVSPDTTILDVRKDASDEIVELHAEDSLISPKIDHLASSKLVAEETVFPPEPSKAFGGVLSQEEPVIRGDFDNSLPESEESHPQAMDQHAKPTKEEVMNSVQEVTEAVAQTKPVRDYVFPPKNLLKAASGKRNGNTKNDLMETANKLQTTLANFGVNVKVTDISCGPAVTRYEIQPEMGVKVSKIVNLADDIKLNLAASDIRIEAPIPGKAAVGIEVPNKENVMVSFRELIDSKEFDEMQSKVSFAVGKDISGQIKIADISKMPHLLIAGATGSGKSVCINTIIMSILYKADPNDVKLIMIDPKVVELSVYNGIPHLLIPVVTDPKKAAGALQWAVNEMTDRYEKFAEASVRDIHGYNQKVAGLTPVEGQEMPQKLPQIVVIVDELADLMMVASGEVEEAICRLAQLARAAGIHLVLATQRPSVNVITGLIKANMPSRIAFAVTSGIDSRTILDMNGAEKLLGKGDMLFNPQGVPKPIRVQGAFISDEEVSRVVEFVKGHNDSSYNEDIQSKVESLQTSGNTTVSISGNMDGAEDGRDPYFVEAAKILLDKDKASIGMLQRYLKVGFNRAARIMDQLEEAGVVGPEEGTKPRRILMSPEQFEQYVDEYL